jgi:hypothetical protein
MTKSIYIQTDERIEALKALEMVVESLRRASYDPYQWKWAIVAMQNAMQALIVTTISGTTGLGAVRPDVMRQWLRELEAGTLNFPEVKLDWFPSLYERMKEEFNYSPDPSVDDSVEKINRFRNMFLHFPQKSWSLEANGLPRIFNDCLSVVSVLIAKTATIASGKNDLMRQLTDLHGRAVKLVKEINSMYDPHGGFF